MNRTRYLRAQRNKSTAGKRHNLVVKGLLDDFVALLDGGEMDDSADSEFQSRELSEARVTEVVPAGVPKWCSVGATNHRGQVVTTSE